ncbi:MAG: hypothetical protein ACRC62_04340 [Microcoleus sp.]
MKSQIKAIVQVKEVAVIFDQCSAFTRYPIFDTLRDAIAHPADNALDAALDQDMEAFELASLQLQAAIARVNTMLLDATKDPSEPDTNSRILGWVQTLISANAVLLQAEPVVPVPVVENESKLFELTVLTHSNPSYKILVQRCAGDSAQADRLIRYEQEKDRSQSYAQATRAAISRLERDRCAV